MSGLNHTLNIGAESLYASRQGVDTAGHNISNAQVEGFSRQRVQLEARMPSEERGLTIGNGVFAKTIKRIHDNFLEKQIIDAKQIAGESGARFQSLSALEDIFSPELSANINDEMSRFFSALQDLSNSPDELAVRTNVIERAQNLVSSFKRVDKTLRNYQGNLNEQLRGDLEAINGKLERIAKLNVEIVGLESFPGAEANDLRDERDRLLRDLSSKMNIDYYNDNRGMMIVRGPRETNLVEGKNFVQFGVVASKNNKSGSIVYDIVISDYLGAASKVVTDNIKSGEIKALLDTRDMAIEDLISQNNEMVTALVEKFNDVHQQGFGVNSFKETQGRNFFEAIKDKNQAALNLKIADIVLESPDAISVASSPHAPGDNVIANALVAVKDQKILSNDGATLMEFYSNYVGGLGLNVERAKHIKDADDIIINDLNTRREAISGVSLDEEAINILKWQTNFAASSKLITTVDEMFETVLSLKR